MPKLKIYLETTLFNYYFDSDRDAHPDTVQLFEDIASGKYEGYTSYYVIDELKRDATDKREKMLALIPKYDIAVLPNNEDAEELADIYVSEGVIPPRFRTDGIHIAIASVYELDMIISMNFQHIVKRKTIRMTTHINALHDYPPIEIFNPMEVNDNESSESD